MYGIEYVNYVAVYQKTTLPSFSTNSFSTDCSSAFFSSGVSEDVSVTKTR